MKDELPIRLNRETARISWPELERHFARGAVIAVAQGMDLVEVACAMARDENKRMAAWLDAGRVSRADAEQARDWHAREAEFWAVVVAPWVLVQESVS